MRVMLYEAAQSMSAYEEMVLAQGLGDANRQASRNQGDRGPSAPIGRDHAPHMGGWTEFRWTRNKPQLQHERCRIKSNRRKLELHRAVERCPRGTTDEVSSHVRLDLPFVDGKAALKIVPPRPRIRWWKGLGADSEEKREPVSASRLLRRIV